MFETPRQPNKEQYQIPTQNLRDFYDERNEMIDSQNEPDYTGMGKHVLAAVENDIAQREAEVSLDANATPEDELALAQELKAVSPVNNWQDELLIADAKRRIAEQNDTSAVH